MILTSPFLAKFRTISPRKKRAILGITIILAVVIFFTFSLYSFKKPIKQNTPNELTKVVLEENQTEIPTTNKMAYTRCVVEGNLASPSDKPDACYLFISEMLKPWTETKIFTFNNIVTLVGFVDQEIYFIEDGKLAYLSIPQRTTVTISDGFLDQHNPPYLDSVNKKIYFSTQGSSIDNKSDYGTLEVYDIGKKVRTVLESGLEQAGRRVLFADDNNIYLACNETPFCGSIWSSTYSIKENTLSENLPIPKEEAKIVAFSQTRKIAYIKTADLGNETYSVGLYIADLNGENPIEVKIISANLGTHGPDNSFSEIAFDPLGEVLSFVITEETAESPKTYHLWSLRSNKENFLLLPWDTMLKWVKYVDPPFHTLPATEASGIIYSSGSLWNFSNSFFARGFEDTVDFTSLTLLDSGPEVILLGASQLIITP